MTSVWQAASRVAAWAPDEARELVARSADRAPHDEARAAEILARAFAATGAWELARNAFTAAAEAWELDDPTRALAVRGVVGELPLEGFVDDESAVAAELEILRRLLDPESPTPVVRRTLVELQRAVTPLRVVGHLEAALGLSPAETALLVAAAAASIDPTLPALTAEVWEPLIASSTLGPAASIARLVRLGAVIETPELVAAPGIVSWLLGRRTLEHAGGARLHLVTPSLVVTETRDARALVIDDVSVATSDPAALAGSLLLLRRKLFAVRVAAGTSAAAITAASLEARIHGGVPLFDLDGWEATDLPLLADLAPCAVVEPRGIVTS